MYVNYCVCDMYVAKGELCCGEIDCDFKLCMRKVLFEVPSSRLFVPLALARGHLRAALKKPPLVDPSLP